MHAPVAVSDRARRYHGARAAGGATPTTVYMGPAGRPAVRPVHAANGDTDGAAVHA